MSNPQLGICMGSIAFVVAVTLILVIGYASTIIADQKAARLKDEARLQAEAEEAAAWREYQKTLKPSPGPGSPSIEYQREYAERKRRENAEALLRQNPNSSRRFVPWSEASGEVIEPPTKGPYPHHIIGPDPLGGVSVAIGRDGKKYNMAELEAHMGRIYRSSGDRYFNRMMAEVFILYHTYPTDLKESNSDGFLYSGDVAAYAGYR